MHAMGLHHAKPMVGHGHVKEQMQTKSMLLVILYWTRVDACYEVV